MKSSAFENDFQVRIPWIKQTSGELSKDFNGEQEQNNRKSKQHTKGHPGPLGEKNLFIIPSH